MTIMSATLGTIKSATPCGTPFGSLLARARIVSVGRHGRLVCKYPISLIYLHLCHVAALYNSAMAALFGPFKSAKSAISAISATCTPARARAGVADSLLADVDSSGSVGG